MRYSAPGRRGVFYNFPGSVLAEWVQDTRAQRPYRSHEATPDQLTPRGSAETSQINSVFLKRIASEQSFLMKLVLLQATYFPWRSSRLKSRCKCYQGSDTATSSPPIAKENLRENNPQNLYHLKQQCHYYGNRRANQAWEREATSSPANGRAAEQGCSVKLALSWKEGEQRGFSWTLNDSKYLTPRCVHRCTSSKRWVFNAKNTLEYQNVAKHCLLLSASFPIARPASSSLLPSPNEGGGTQDFSEGTALCRESPRVEELPGNLSAGVRRKHSALLGFTAKR